MGKTFEFKKEEIKKFLKGSAISIGLGAIAALSDFIISQEWGIYTTIVVSATGILYNAVDKWLRNIPKES